MYTGKSTLSVIIMSLRVLKPHQRDGARDSTGISAVIREMPGRRQLRPLTIIS